MTYEPWKARQKVKRKNSLPADSADWSPGPDGRMGISLRSFPCHALQNAMRAFLLSASSDGKGENLKYSLLVHSQRRFHYNLVTAHVINAGLTCPTRCFSKWGMCNFIYLQRCSTILPYTTGTKMHSQQKKAISELSFVTGKILWVNHTLVSHPGQQDTTVWPSHHRLLNGALTRLVMGSYKQWTANTVALPGNEWPRLWPLPALTNGTWWAGIKKAHLLFCHSASSFRNPFFHLQVCDVLSALVSALHIHHWSWTRLHRMLPACLLANEYYF